MPTIQISRLLKSKKENVYKILKEMEAFPSFMKNVLSLLVEKKEGNKLITSWQADIDGAIVMWKEEDSFDDQRQILEFHMLEGDYKSYDGIWQLEETPKGTKISLTANFDWGIPVFEKFVGKILERKARVSLQGMLKAIEKRLEVK